MTPAEFNETLLERIPEIRPSFEEYTSWQDGIDTGSILVCEDVLTKLIVTALHWENGDAFLRRTFDFVEEMVSGNDEYAKTAVECGVLESLASYEERERIEPYLGPLSQISYRKSKEDF